MSKMNDSTWQDKPEYIPGDVIEVFNPETKTYEWVEVEDASCVHNSQILIVRGCYFCSCWVRVEFLATPRMSECSIERKEGD